jgi:hypothetical protein
MNSNEIGKHTRRGSNGHPNLQLKVVVSYKLRTGTSMRLWFYDGSLPDMFQHVYHRLAGDSDQAGKWVIQFQD